MSPRSLWQHWVHDLCWNFVFRIHVATYRNFELRQVTMLQLWIQKPVTILISWSLLQFWVQDQCCYLESISHVATLSLRPKYNFEFGTLRQRLFQDPRGYFEFRTLWQRLFQDPRGNFEFRTLWQRLYQGPWGNFEFNDKLCCVFVFKTLWHHWVQARERR